MPQGIQRQQAPDGLFRERGLSGMPCMLQPLAQSIASLSVRTRIIGLALIPVVGFLANGIAFTTGQSEVNDAFANAGTAAALADASREFKLALATMQIAAKDYVAQPSDERARAFEAARMLTTGNFDKIAAAAKSAAGRQWAGSAAAERAPGQLRLSGRRAAGARLFRQ
jgi:hypothetical protein